MIADFIHEWDLMTASLRIVQRERQAPGNRSSQRQISGFADHIEFQEMQNKNIMNLWSFATPTHTVLQAD